MKLPTNKDWSVSDVDNRIPDYSIDASDLIPYRVALDPWDNVLPDPLLFWKQHRDQEGEVTHYTYQKGNEYTLTIWND